MNYQRFYHLVNMSSDPSANFVELLHDFKPTFICNYLWRLEEKVTLILILTDNRLNMGMFYGFNPQLSRATVLLVI